MEMKLAENIRSFRKERKLTQEQLAEVMSVTPGAVYKWEAGLSVPDIALIMEMADFFDTSVDVLLGYAVKDNRVEATVKRLREYRRGKDRSVLAEAEKALMKYPHSFQIVNESATLYLALGFDSGDKALFRRALELLERCCLLLPQNNDPQISEETIYGRIADAYQGMDETDKAVELLKAHNAGGEYSHEIGNILAQNDRPEEARRFLSEALLKHVSALVTTINGYVNMYYNCGDHESMQAILSWGTALLSGLREGDKANYFDRICAALLAALAGAQFVSGQKSAARGTLTKAKELAAFFDASPSYDESDIRFVSRIEGASVHDDLGATATDGVDLAVSQFDNEAFTALWRSVIEREDHYE